MKREYTWAEQGFGIDPAVAGTEVERIEKRHGRVTAQIVVEEALDVSSPLHNMIFHVDQQNAARIHYEERARLLLRSLRIKVVDSPTETVRAFISVVNGAEGKEQRYASVEEVSRVDELRTQYRLSIRARLIGLKKELLQFDEFAKVVAAIHDIEQAEKAA